MPLLLIALAGTVVAASLAWFIARRMTRPIESLTASTTLVATTMDFDHPIAVTRHGRSQESMAVSGIFPSIVASRRVHKESSIVRLLVGGAARSYTQSYPQVWITGGIPDDLGSGGATSADQVATSHQFRQTRDRRYTFSTARLVCVREATLP